MAGETLFVDTAGVLYWPAGRLMAVADLHLEKGSAQAARGNGLIPPHDSMTTLASLAAAIGRYRPALVIALGDSFHDGEAAARIAPADKAAVRALTASVDWIWIAGNHDPAPPTAFGGRVEPTIVRGPFTFRHEPAAAPASGEIAGHLHPKAAVRQRGKRLTRRCFASDGSRVVMPAFGAYTGGLDVLDPAFDTVFPGAFHAWMLGRDTVYPIASRRLVRIGA